MQTWCNMKNNIYTMKDWERDGSLRLSPGMLVDVRIVRELKGGVPPAYMHYGVLQPGEPYTHDTETREHLYQTFIQCRNAFETWKYIGLCALGSVKPSEHPYE